MGIKFDIFKRYLENALWLIAIIALYNLNTSEREVSLCLSKVFLNRECLGCGIGASIHDALHLQFYQSFEKHSLGIPSIIIIIYTNIKQIFNKYKLAQTIKPI
jgi:phosphoheptose isomerase